MKSLSVIWFLGILIGTLNGMLISKFLINKNTTTPKVNNPQNLQQYDIELRWGKVVSFETNEEKCFILTTRNGTAISCNKKIIPQKRYDFYTVYFNTQCKLCFSANCAKYDTVVKNLSLPLNSLDK